MIRTFLYFSALVGVVGSVGLGNGVEQFSHSRTIQVPAGKERLVSLPLDPSLLSKVDRHWEDLRLFDTATNHEVPYIVRTPVRTKTTEVTTSLDNKVVSFRKLGENEIQIVCELEKDQKPATSLTVSTPLSDFEREIRVEVSQTGSQWDLLVDDAIIFDYRQFADVRKTSVSLPDNTGRFYRVTINRAMERSEKRFLEISRMSGYSGEQDREEHKSIKTRAFRIDRIHFHRTVEKLVSDVYIKNRYPVDGLVVDESDESGDTILEWKSHRVPVSGFELTIGERNFRREVKVYGRQNDESGWRLLKQKEIFHYELEDFKKQDLAVSFGENRMVQYRLVIANRGAQALDVSGLVAVGPAYEMVWLAAPEANYAVYTGATDLETVHDARFIHALIREGFPIDSAGWGGGVEENLAYEKAPTRLFDQSHILWGSIVLAVGILIFVLFQTARKIEEMPPES